MPEFVEPDHFKAQVILNPAAFPVEDRIVNVFHFRNDIGPAALRSAIDTAIKNRLETFYAAVGPHLTNALPANGELRTYDLGSTPPRTPNSLVLNTGTKATAQGLPRELAVCTSYFGDGAPITDPSINTQVPRRQRTGRLYLGPLTTNALNVAGGGSFQRVHATLVTAFADASAALADADASNAVRWVLRSLDKQDSYVISHGWVDNEFDIQRRRGRDADSRTEWAA